MSTVTSEPLAFRCTKCWQLTCTSTDRVGQQVACESCGQMVEVPEATRQRIEQGRQQLAEREAAEETPVVDVADTQVEASDRDIYRQARQEARAKAAPEQLVCSRMRRFLGHLIDGVATMIAAAAGAILAFLISPPAADEMNIVFLMICLIPPLMLSFVQWSMTAMDGRTIGKYCVNTKVVNLQGEAPGWLQGVVLRSWVVVLLNMVPFFGLLDAAWIFANESKRCLHDLLAGTYVIEAS